MLPLHPDCSCRYQPFYKNVRENPIKNPVKSTMEKLSLNEQRQIVGSHEKLQEFRNGADIVTLFNRVRPQYPVGYYRDVLGYNGGMEKFDKYVLLDNEIKAIEEWTADSDDIKKAMWKSDFKSYNGVLAKSLFGLFDKYSTNMLIGTKIYRGLSLTDDEYKIFKYDILKKGDVYSPDTKAIVSFSRDKRVAYDFAEDGQGSNNIILKTLSTNTTIDITQLSVLEEERETIINSNMWYNIVNVKRIGKWTIIILKKTQ